MIIAVGSENPVKIAAVTDGFSSVFVGQRVKVTGVLVPSGISTQPMSDEESLRGARNRARLVLQRVPGALFGVGVEGGVQVVGKIWYNGAWVVVRDRTGKEGIGASAKIEVPAQLMRLIQKGMELGDADDVVYGRKNSKRAEGHFGIMTNNLLTRREVYKDAVIAALACFIKKEGQKR